MKGVEKSDWGAYVPIVITGCLWGSIGIFVKMLIAAGATPAYAGFLRIATAIPFLLLLILVKEGPRGLKIDFKTMKMCLLLGVICQAVFNVCYSTSIDMVGVTMGAVLLYTSPVFTGVASMIVFKERFNARKWTGLAMNIIGCVLTATGGNFREFRFSPMGIGFGVAAGFCYGMAAIFGKFATRESSPYVVAAYNFLFGSLCAAVAVRPWRGVKNPMDPKIMILGTAFGIVTAGLAYVFFFTGVKRIKESSKVPVIASVELIIAALTGALLFSEIIGITNLVGIMMVLFSIVLFT